MKLAWVALQVNIAYSLTFLCLWLIGALAGLDSSWPATAVVVFVSRSEAEATRVSSYDGIVFCHWSEVIGNLNCHCGSEAELLKVYFL